MTSKHADSVVAQSVGTKTHGVGSSALDGRYFIALLAGFFLTSLVRAEVLPVDLPKCISIALERSPRLKVSTYGIDIAEANLKQARSGRKPRVELMNFTGAVPEARGNSVFSPDRTTDIDDLGPFNRLEINFIQPIYTFGKLNAYIDAALHGLDAERAQRGQKRDELVYDVKKLYYALLLNTELRKTLTSAEENFSKAHDTMEEIIDGDREAPNGEEPSMLDFVKLKVGISQVSYNLKRITNAEQLTSAALKQAMGISDGVQFNLGEAELSVETAELKEFDFYTDQAFRNRPEWQQLEAGIEAKASLLKAAHKDYLPEVFVAIPFRHAVAGNRDDQTNPFVRDDFNFTEGGPVLGVRWQFDFGKSAKVDRARAEHSQLLAQREEARSGIAVEIRKNWLNVKEMEERVRLMRKTRGAARALVTGGAGGADVGVQDLKELFEGYGLYTKAESDYLLAVYEYNLALAELSRAVGIEVTRLVY